MLKKQNVSDEIRDLCGVDHDPCRFCSFFAMVTIESAAQMMGFVNFFDAATQGFGKDVLSEAIEAAEALGETE